MNPGRTEGGGLPPIFERLVEIARTSALEEMASGVAHELNQPLGAIATFAQAGERMLARPQPLVQEAADVLRQITQEAMGAGEGIRRIRKVFNRDAALKAPASMSAMLHELRPLLEAIAQRAGVALHIDTAKNLPPVLAEALRIQHVLFTLVQNAVEASAGRPAAAVGVRVTSDDYRVEVAVQDNGCGIAQSARDQVFRPFFTTKSHGIGLGLASSRAIIEAHEGTIGFESIPDKSTRFWFRLPALAPALRI